MKTCPSCGEGNSDDARFCVACGAAQAARCVRCGAELPAGARFCPSCGAVVELDAGTGQERKLVTVLFADLSGSTGLGERFDPEQLGEIMQMYFEAMRREIEAEGGTVEKFIGDAVMAAFGVPAAHEDDPSRALRAALGMRAALAKLNEHLAAEHDVRLSLRIGVNVGEVVALPRPRPGEAMVVGDAVNVAARLEQVAEPDQIVVSERAARASRGMRFRELGPLQLRGKGQTVQAVELIGEDAQLHGALPGLRPPLVGRDREIALLRSVYQRVASEGRPHLITVYGEAGVGKSRLVEEFTAWAAGLDPPARTHTGRCLPYGEGVSFWPVAEILKRASGVLDSDSPAEALARVEALAGELLSGMDTDPAQLAERLAFTIGLPGPDGAALDADPRGARQEVTEAWTKFFSALGAGDPAVIHMEDVHWADPVMLELLESLSDRVEGPVLFICSARPELTGRSPGWGGGRWNFSSVLLEPLAAGDAERLVEQLLDREAPGVEPAPGIQDIILERAGGNPFFLEEIVRHLAEDKRLGGDVGAPVEIPDTVQGVLAARMDLLAPGEKRALQAAAVVGKEFWPGPVALLEGVDSSRLDQTLDRLRERGLILSRLSSSIAGEREFMFKHVLTRDVAYESIPRRDRALAHARVASWIEGQAGDRSREFVELLAHHYGEAHAAARLDPHVNPEERERLRGHAFDYALRASEESRRKLASDQAIRLARAALEVADRPLERARALEVLGEACVNESRGDEAWDALRQAVDIRLESGDEDPPAVARLAARALEIPTRMPGFMRVQPRDGEASPYLEAGLSHAGAGDTEELARLLVVQAFWPYSFVEGDAGEDRVREAREAGERAAAMALRLERPALASAALDAVATSYISRGNYGGVRAVMKRRLDLASRLDDPWELGDIHASAAWAAIMAGRYREALELAGRGYELVRLGPPAIALYCLDWRAVARFHLGQWDGFFDDVAVSEELMTGRDDPPLHALQHIAVAAFVHEVRGEPDRADACVDLLAAHGREEGSMGPFWEPWLARLHARRGGYEEAERRLTLAEGERADRAELGLVLESRCDLAGDRGSWDEAPGLLADARSHAEEGGLQALLAHAGRLEGRAAVARGDLSEGANLLRDSREAFVDLGARWEAAVTELVLAEALAAVGRTTEAAPLAEAASQVFDEIGAREELERCRDLTAT